MKMSYEIMSAALFVKRDDISWFTLFSRTVTLSQKDIRLDYTICP